eukprot:7345061-Karenia_brevis.AAC.1
MTATGHRCQMESARRSWLGHIGGGSTSNITERQFLTFTQCTHGTPALIRMLHAATLKKGSTDYQALLDADLPDASTSSSANIQATEQVLQVT